MGGCLIGAICGIGAGLVFTWLIVGFLVFLTLLDGHEWFYTVDMKGMLAVFVSAGTILGAMWGGKFL